MHGAFASHDLRRQTRYHDVMTLSYPVAYSPELALIAPKGFALREREAAVLGGEHLQAGQVRGRKCQAEWKVSEYRKLFKHTGKSRACGLGFQNIYKHTCVLERECPCGQYRCKGAEKTQGGHVTRTHTGTNDWDPY